MMTCRGGCGRYYDLSLKAATSVTQRMSNIPLVPDEMLDEMLLFFGMAKAAILTRMHVNSVCVCVCVCVWVCVCMCVCLFVFVCEKVVLQKLPDNNAC